VQSAEQVEMALAQEHMARPEGVSILSTTPDAYFALEERGVECRSAHEFAPNEDLNNIASENYQKVRGAVRDLDLHLHDRYPALPAEFNPYKALEYQIKHLADSTAFVFKELSGFLQAESPDKLQFWSNIHGPKDGLATHGPVLPETGHAPLHPADDTIASHLLNMSFWSEQFGIQPMPLPQDSKAQRLESRSPWRQTIRKTNNPHRIEAVRDLGLRSALKPFKGKRQRLLVTGRSPNIFGFVRQALSKQLCSVDWWTRFKLDPIHLGTLRTISLGHYEDAIKSGKTAMSRKASHPSECISLTQWGDEESPVRDLIRERLTRYEMLRIPYLYSLYMRTLGYFEKYRPAAMICGTTTRDEIQIMLQAARVKGVPSISFQHGGGYGYMDLESLSLSDLRTNIYAGYGPKGCDYLEGLAASRGQSTDVVSIGWPTKPRLVSPATTSENMGQTKSKSGKKTQACHSVMYIPTGLNGDLRYGPFHDLDDTEYALKQIQIIALLGQLIDTDVIVKLHPKDKLANPLERWIRRQEYPRVRVLTREKLDELLPLVDTVLLDCPTTSLIEAMADAKRIVYLDMGVYRWSSDGEALMRSSAVWVDRTPGWETRLDIAIVASLLSRSLGHSQHRRLATKGYPASGSARSGLHGRGFRRRIAQAQV